MPFFTEAPRSFVPEGISVIVLRAFSSVLGPAKRAFSVSVRGESDFDNLRVTIWRLTDPSDPMTTKQSGTFIVAAGCGALFGLCVLSAFRVSVFGFSAVRASLSFSAFDFSAGFVSPLFSASARSGVFCPSGIDVGFCAALSFCFVRFGRLFSVTDDSVEFASGKMSI